MSRCLADGVAIEPAGEAHDGAGHFHVIADAGCVATGDAIAKDADHVHVGSGASTTTIYLAPGEHTLCLQVGDGVHTALAITDTVQVEVGIADRKEFCDVLAEVDPILDGVWDEPDFAAGQAQAANAARLVEQLRAATQHVDADAQPAVEELLQFTASILDATAAVETPEELDAQWEALSQDTDIAAIEDVAFPWASDTCGLDLE